MRPSRRKPQTVAPVDELTRGYTRHAEGSVLIECGDTRVICTASVEEQGAAFLKGKGQGWLTAEYGMLPRSTNTRTQREAASGKQSGRTQEIQRLIGRSLRCGGRTWQALGERTMHIDCDVIQADGGTRTASITGAFVALHDAVRVLSESAANADAVADDAISSPPCRSASTRACRCWTSTMRRIRRARPT